MPRRLRTFTLWAGALLCVLIAAAFVASGWWLLAFQVPTSCGPAVAVNAGLCIVILDQQWSVAFVVERGGELSFSGQSRPGWRRWTVWAGGRPYVCVPLYAVFLIVAVPTALLWHRDRRFRPLPGHCPCGYDLRGNVSGTCPECGLPSGKPTPVRSEGVVSRVQRIARERDDADA